MGQRGPVGKRTDEIMGHKTKAELAEREQVAVPAEQVPVPDADPTWHPIAREWFESLGESGQSQFFEPSDWATARYVAEAMHQHLQRGASMGAQMFAAVMSAASELLSTEGSRRRLRLELQRAQPTQQDNAGVTAINEYKRRITG
ncbi:phage terminase small subunit [Amycolatopsis dendrobii]|uniref:Terminase small subunit n=1 Tax=Amycolatopsis dendrobii TaxID=2760662 RepID=A0A7W3Z9L0_9PSEU|nr:hypothetical protein [Amycolatopsis dendrobii]MBB1153506.1 hypothetical protein [Amycolatopsis dendrobii]